jgi:hypothetical protein
MPPLASSALDEKLNPSSVRVFEVRISALVTVSKSDTVPTPAIKFAI